MSSPFDALEKAVNERCAEVEAKTKNNIELALEATEEKVSQKIKEIIERDAMDFYYNGYLNPKLYVRTGQLRNSTTPYIEEYKSGNQIGFDYGAQFNPDAMDHSEYEIHITRLRQNGNVWEKTYTYQDDDVDEEKILKNFRAGIHPNTDVNQGKIWAPGMEGHAPDVLRKWKNSDAIRQIFREELKKLIKKS